MTHLFKFPKNRANVELFRINVRDKVNGDYVIDPDTLTKIELVFFGEVDVVISSSTGEITWQGNVIQIKPSEANRSLLLARCDSELIVYKNDDKTSISIGQVLSFESA
ncbi:MAG: hypothetical protein ACJAUY_000682 [Cognaticolwellia sp.]|jgi:hypothetical protein